MLSSAYMTQRQKMIWKMNMLGLPQAEISREIGVSRQAVHNALNIALKKIELALRHVAEANRIDVRYIDPINGILLGFSPSINKKVIITFSTKHGIHVWHYENPDCSKCKFVSKCRSILLDEAEERNIILSKEEKRLPPSKLAHLIFSKIIPGLEP
jgi:DNA-binding CsgD family transcriptional regulator